MEILLIVLIIFLLFLNKELFAKPDNSKKCVESLSVEMPDSEAPSFNPNSRNNDYYYDRTGMKGILFKPLSDKKKYMMPNEEPLVLDYHKTIRKLELYPEKFYAKCVSDFNQDKLLPPHINFTDAFIPGPYGYLTYNQGMLI
jgi:hypothetical protein